MPSFNEIDRTIQSLKNDNELNKLLEDNEFVLANIDNKEYFALSELLLDNNEILANTTVLSLVEDNILKQDISNILRIGDTNRARGTFR